jgi:hypothetical protein
VLVPFAAELVHFSSGQAAQRAVVLIRINFAEAFLDAVLRHSMHLQVLNDFDPPPVLDPEFPAGKTPGKPLLIQQAPFDEFRDEVLHLRCGRAQFIELVAHFLVASLLVIGVSVDGGLQIHQRPM